jgi:uncharacterized protein (UPF0335 family)
VTAAPPKVGGRSIVTESADQLSQNQRSTVQLQNSTKDQLRAIVARIERLEEEKAALAADLREVYAEAKGNGFDVKALRAVVRIRKQDENKRKEEEAVLVTYLHALGMSEAEAA